MMFISLSYLLYSFSKGYFLKIPNPQWILISAIKIETKKDSWFLKNDSRQLDIWIVGKFSNIPDLQ